MKFKELFKGVPDGEIYPVEFQPGDECPPELLDAAKELGAVAGDGDEPKSPAAKKVPAK